MVFSSIKFIFVFMPAVLLVYFLAFKYLANTVRKVTILNGILLVSSLWFYIEGEKNYVWVMLLTGAIDYVIALLIEREQQRQPDMTTRTLKQKLLLLASITGNMGLLFYFKYTNFALDLIAPGHSNVFHVILPIGISFYTFESMSYTIDVYRGETPATRKFVAYWTFITFFPHLIAGPIIRYSELRRQLEQRKHNWENVLIGFRRFVIGLSKKVIIANPMGYHADYLFALDPTRIDTFTAWLAAVAYTLQIYFDFSGYTDMAIGLGKIFGIDLPQNFNYPYISKSIKEFWRRWHMTLSSWFRDYLYIPLGGNKKGVIKEYRNLFLVFFLCGLWHGASLNFIVWGCFHGVFLVLERILRNIFSWKPPVFVLHLYTLLVIIFGWVVFRAETMPQTMAIWKAMLGMAPAFVSEDAIALLFKPHFFVFAVLGIFFSIPLKLYCGDKFIDKLITLPRLRYELIFLALFLVSTVFLCGEEYNPFIYFRF